MLSEHNFQTSQNSSFGITQNFQGLKLLLIDDDKVDRQSICRVLRKISSELDICECENLEEGVKAISHEKYDCVLLDYLLPPQNGLEGLKILRQVSPYIPVIMITGHWDEILAVRAIRNGVENYLPKDRITKEVLWNAVLIAIENGKLKKKIDIQRYELENFGRICAHDLKAPLRNIRNFIELVNTDIAGQNYERITDYCERIDKSAGYMDQLIDTLRAYSKLNVMQIEYNRVSLHHILEVTLHNLNSIIMKKNADIRWDNTLPEIWCHEIEIIQLFQNLLGNSLKYCDKDRPVITLNVEDRENFWIISVQDNGIGIEKDYLEIIFEPFQRLHHKNEYEGTGLGLATCQKIVTRHGGHIWCESEKNQGTRFIFTLHKHCRTPQF
jgi:signal transduction histidine kinase